MFLANNETKEAINIISVRNDMNSAPRYKNLIRIAVPSIISNGGSVIAIRATQGSFSIW